MDRLAVPTLGGRSAYTVMGLVGIAASYLIMLVVALADGLDVAIPGVVLVTSVATLIVVAKGVQMTLGREVMVLYQNVISALAANGLVAAALGWPVLGTLDLNMLGLAVFLVFGRLGCTLVGCCHGRPYSRGIAYGTAHPPLGFPRYYVGVRLFPTQLAGVGFFVLLTAAQLAMGWAGWPAGSGVVVTLSAYAVFRFALEFERGDSERPTGAGLSEAQWTSLFVAALLVLLTWTGWMPHRWPSLGAALSVTALAAGVTLHRRRHPHHPHHLLSPRRVREIHQTLDRAVGTAGEQPVSAALSFGVRISVSLPLAGGPWRETQYGFSGDAFVASPEAIERMTEQLVYRHAPGSSWTRVASDKVPGLFLVVVRGAGEWLPSRTQIGVERVD
jgi:prolipoprotein diacylglyceryltransferase